MTGLLLAGTALTALTAGMVGGWALRGHVARWCRLCGLPTGAICIECRDRRRAHHLTNATA